MNKVQPVLGGAEDDAPPASPVPKAASEEGAAEAEAEAEAVVGKTAALSLAPANLITPDGEGEPAGVKSPDGKKFDPNWGRPEEEARRNAISTYALRDHLTQQFPMYALSISKLLTLDRMMSYEELMETGDISEWEPAKGPVFFISHQWTAFNEPDHSRTQLSTLKVIFQAMRDGTFKSLFGSEQEWSHFSTKDPVGSMEGVFEKISEEQMAKEAMEGHIWLDYSCVPQAASAQEPRLRAIESIPHYIDSSTTFFALCPPVQHKELGHTCDYHTWRNRGWCRLEEQVNELKLFEFSDRALPQFGPGITAWDVPRRPVMVLSETHLTCVDMFDHFYTLGVRSQTVMNGDFACCSLDHKKVFDDGTVLCLPCDKDRIRPFCRSMWQRKSNHFSAGNPFTRHMFAWRYISHMTLMLATGVEDTPTNNDDPLLSTLDDIKRKYFMDEPEWAGMMTMMSGFPLHLGMGMLQKTGDSGQLGAQEFIPGNVADGYNVGQLTQADNMSDLKVRGERLAAALQQEGEAKYVNHALAMMIAEGNLKMVQYLVEEKGGDVTLGMPWAMCTGVDFAAGKGHLRVLKYLLDKGAICDLNHLSHMQLIGAVDRAAKGGFQDALRMLVEDYGATLHVVRRNGETPAHGAAMHGHIETLKYLKSQGCDLHAKSYDCTELNGVEYKARTPLECARYFYQSECIAFLEADAAEVAGAGAGAVEGEAVVEAPPVNLEVAEEEARPAEEAAAATES